jgi:hypothetical protein
MNPTLQFSNGGTPDYYNQCAIATSEVSVPNNHFGFQPAHNGNGYAGVHLFDGTLVDYREYVEGILSTTLVSNITYHFQMYVNLANNVKYSTDAFGVYFSDTLITGITNYFPLPFTPQINNAAGIISDTLNWTLVNGNYTATGGENYLIIGNFKNNSNTVLTTINNSAPYYKAYIYIDDVCLSPDSTYCSLWSSINNIKENNIGINISPNPFNDKLIFKNTDNELSEIILYDIASRKIMQMQFTNSVSLNTQQLTKGLYIYEVRSKIGLCKKGKVVKD